MRNPTGFQDAFEKFILRTRLLVESGGKQEIFDDVLVFLAWMREKDTWRTGIGERGREGRERGIDVANDKLRFVSIAPELREGEIKN